MAYTCPLRPESELDLVVSLWRAGGSFATIAGRLQCSRCAVAGIIHRARRRLGIEAVPARPQPPAKPKVRKPRASRASAVKLGPALRFDPVTRRPETGELHTVGRRLLDLCPQTCRWPVTDDRPFLFCSAPADGAYCRHHAVLSRGRF